MLAGAQGRLANAPAAARVCVPELPCAASRGTILDLLQVPHRVRYLRDGGAMSEVPDAIPGGPVPELSRLESDRRLDASAGAAFLLSGVVGANEKLIEWIIIPPAKPPPCTHQSNDPPLPIRTARDRRPKFGDLFLSGCGPSEL